MIQDPSYPSEGVETGVLIDIEEEKKERNFSDFVDCEQKQEDESVEESTRPDHSLYMPLGDSPPRNNEVEAAASEATTAEA